MSNPAGDDFEPSPLTEKVSRAGGAPVRTLRGFTLGKSPDEGRWRLYLDTDLSHYIEFDKKDAVHAEEVAPGRTLVWLVRNARVTESTSRTLPVEFLQGEIRTGFLRGLSGLTGAMAMNAEGCPCSGCAHCTTSCSSLPGGNSIGLSCGC